MIRDIVKKSSAKNVPRINQMLDGNRRYRLSLKAALDKVYKVHDTTLLQMYVLGEISVGSWEALVYCVFLNSWGGCLNTPAKI